VANGIGALVWAAAFTAIGFYAAEWWHSTSTLMHVAIAAVVVPLAGYWLIARRKRRRDVEIEPKV